MITQCIGPAVAMLVLLQSCNARSAEEARIERSDAEALQRAFALDAVPAILEDVDRAFDEGRTIRAAELLAAGAIPASRREIERVRGTHMRSEKGTALVQRIAAAYEARTAALEQYHAALANGDPSDTALVQALDAQRRAEEGLLALHEELEAMRPLRTEKRLPPRPNR